MSVKFTLLKRLKDLKKKRKTKHHLSSVLTNESYFKWVRVAHYSEKKITALKPVRLSSEKN